MVHVKVSVLSNAMVHVKASVHSNAIIHVKASVFQYTQQYMYRRAFLVYATVHVKASVLSIRSGTCKGERS